MDVNCKPETSNLTLKGIIKQLSDKEYYLEELVRKNDTIIDIMHNNIPEIALGNASMIGPEAAMPVKTPNHPLLDEMHYCLNRINSLIGQCHEQSEIIKGFFE